MALIEFFAESGMIGNKCQIRDKSGDVWNGSAFVTYVAGSRGTYEIALPEDQESCWYRASFPAAIAPGRYTVLGYTSDNGPLGSFTGTFDGTDWEAGWLTPTRTLSSAGVQAIWDALLTAITTVGSIGKLIKDFLDASISTRLAAGSYSAAPTVTQIRTEMDSNSTKLVNLDATVSSRLSAAGYTVPPTVVAVRQEMDSNSTKLANLDAAVTTRLASGNVAADVTAIKAKTDNLPVGVAKNAALNNFEFLMIDSADHVSVMPALTVTAERSIDGAAFAACANAVSEVSNGVYKINLAAADLNGNVITLKFTADGADARFITIVTDA